MKQQSLTIQNSSNVMDAMARKEALSSLEAKASTSGLQLLAKMLKEHPGALEKLKQNYKQLKMFL